MRLNKAPRMGRAVPLRFSVVVTVGNEERNLAGGGGGFLGLGGFDEWFRTAEDIDLNLRAGDAGATIAYEPEAVVYHRTRGSYYGFLRQAFWNTDGRKH